MSLQDRLDQAFGSLAHDQAPAWKPTSQNICRSGPITADAAGSSDEEFEERRRREIIPGAPRRRRWRRRRQSRRCHPLALPPALKPSFGTC